MDFTLLDKARTVGQGSYMSWELFDLGIPLNVSFGMLRSYATVADTVREQLLAQCKLIFLSVIIKLCIFASK